MASKYNKNLLLEACKALKGGMTFSRLNEPSWKGSKGGYVEFIKRVCTEASMILKACEYPGNVEKKSDAIIEQRDVSLLVKERFRFLHGELDILMRAPRNGGKVKAVLVITANNNVQVFDGILASMLQEKIAGDGKQIPPAASRRFCAIYDGDEALGVSICHWKDNYSRAEGRYLAYEDAKNNGLA